MKSRDPGFAACARIAGMLLLALLPLSTLRAQLTITSLNPTFQPTTNPVLTIAVTGNGFFTAACAVQWNGTQLATTFAGPTAVSASVPYSFYQTVQGTQYFNITVACPGIVSNALRFQVMEGFGISSLSPTSVPAGSPQFILTVNGSGFQPNHFVQWNGVQAATTYVSRNQLRATIPAAMVAGAGIADITVVAPGNGFSVPFKFTITPVAPQLVSLNPNTAAAGGAEFTLTATGINFAAGAVLTWNGLPIPTTFLSATQVAAAVTESRIAVPGSANIAVMNPGNATSNTLTLSIACRYLIGGTPVGSGSVTSAVISPGGGPGTVTVTTAPTCSWNASSSASWLTISSAAGGAGSGSVAYVASANTGPDRSATLSIAGQTFTVTQLSGQNLPQISSTRGVVNAAGLQTAVASGTWISIVGTNLAGATRSWDGSDFVGSRLPTRLDGVGVNINGKSSYVSYISPTQINALAPEDAAEGSVPVQVITSAGSSASVTVQKQRLSPALFTLSAQNGRYAVAVLPDGSLAGPPDLYQGNPRTRPARPGETILLYATGLGPTTPPYPEGQIIVTPVALQAQPSVQVGGVSAAVQYAGLVGAGLYQINLQVPDVHDGDAALLLQIQGFASQDNLYLTIQR